MKHALLKTLLGAGLMAVSVASSADFFDFGGNDGDWKMGPYGPYYDESDWPEWTPMYWAEEFADEIDDNNDDDYWRYGPPPGYGGGYGPGYGGGYGPGPGYGYGPGPGYGGGYPPPPPYYGPGY